MRASTDRRLAPGERLRSALIHNTELCCLLAVTVAPCFFNVASTRQFEGDKAACVRILAIVALASEALVLLGGNRPPERSGVESSLLTWRDLLALWPAKRRRTGMAIVVLLGSALLSAAASIAPGVSWWGSYERQQGALTLLAYAVLSSLAVTRRSLGRGERIAVVVEQSAVAAALYGIVQALRLDPFVWVGQAGQRPGGTFGSAASLAAYAAMAVPFLVRRLLHPTASDSGIARHLAMARWGGAQVLLLASIFLSAHSRWFGEPLRLLLALGCATATWAGAATASNQERQRGFFRAARRAITGAWIAWTCLALGAGSTRLSPWLGVALAALVGLEISDRERSSAGVGELRPEGSKSRGDHRAFRFGLGGLGILACIAVVLLSQTRSAQAGLLAGLGVAAILSPRTWRGRLLGSSAVAVGAALLVFVNLSEHPSVIALRAMPYAGRLTRLIDFAGGTGRERLLIWRGDETGGGVVGLVMTSPLRSLIGYGPDTLALIFPRQLPASLLVGTSHQLVPDRAHDIWLDAWFTQGLVGMIALAAVHAAALWCAWALRDQAPTRSLGLACLTALVIFVVDGIAGIPSTASLLTTWLVLSLTLSPLPLRSTVGATEGFRLRARWGGVALVAALTALLLGRECVAIEADMWLRWSRDAETPETRCHGLDQALALRPEEPTYWRELAELLVETSPDRAGGPRESVVPLAEAARASCATAITATPLERLRAARRALLEAARRQPLDKDTLANQGRVELLLHDATGDAAHLSAAVHALEHANDLAPNDVLILVDRADALRRTADRTALAEDLLRRALAFDPERAETRAALAELLSTTAPAEARRIVLDLHREWVDLGRPELPPRAVRRLLAALDRLGAADPASDESARLRAEFLSATPSAPASVPPPR